MSGAKRQIPALSAAKRTRPTVHDRLAMASGFLCLWAVAVAAPSAHADTTCVGVGQDVDTTSSPAAEMARLGNDARTPDVALTSGSLHFDGVNSMVYKGFSGCGERQIWRLSDTIGSLSVAESRDMDPFRRLRGDPFEAERFVDGQGRGRLGSDVEVGYSLSLHTRDADGEETPHRTTGASAWLAALDGRLTAESGVAVHRDGTAGPSMAQHHQVELEAVRIGDTRLIGFIAYDEAGAGYDPGRSDVAADTRRMRTEARLVTGITEARAALIRSHNNVAGDRHSATTGFSEMQGDLSFRPNIGQGFPSRIAFKTAMKDAYERPGAGGGESKPLDLSERLGIDLTWGTDPSPTTLEIGFDRTDNRAATDRKQTHNSHVALHAVRPLLGARIEGRGRLAWIVEGDDAGGREKVEVGWSVKTSWASQVLEGGFTVGHAGHSAPTWSWHGHLGARLDLLDAVGAAPSADRTFAYGRLGADLRHEGPRTRLGGEVMIVGGVRF